MKYLNDIVYEVRILVDRLYVENLTRLIPEPVSLEIKQFSINDKFELSYNEDSPIPIYYTKHELLCQMFHMSDIKLIIEHIHKNNITLTLSNKYYAIEFLNQIDSK